MYKPYTVEIIYDKTPILDYKGNPILDERGVAQQKYLGKRIILKTAYRDVHILKHSDTEYEVYNSEHKWSEILNSQEQAISFAKYLISYELTQNINKKRIELEQLTRLLAFHKEQSDL